MARLNNSDYADWNELVESYRTQGHDYGTAAELAATAIELDKKAKRDIEETLDLLDTNPWDVR